MLSSWDYNLMSHDIEININFFGISIDENNGWFGTTPKKKDRSDE